MKASELLVSLVRNVHVRVLVYLLGRGFLDTRNGVIRATMPLENSNQINVRIEASNLNEGLGQE